MERDLGKLMDQEIIRTIVRTASEADPRAVCAEMRSADKNPTIRIIVDGKVLWEKSS